jgi:hypothetical protein
MSHVEERRNSYRLVLRQLWIAEIDDLLLLAPIPDRIADNAVLGWCRACDERDVRRPRYTGERGHHASGRCALLHQQPQRGKVGTRVVQIAGGQTIDADQNDVLGLRRRGSFSLVPELFRTTG